MDMLKECSMHDKKYIKTLTSTNANLKKEEQYFIYDVNRYYGMVGNLMFLNVGSIINFMQAPNDAHTIVLKRIFRYVKDMTKFGMTHTNIK